MDAPISLAPATLPPRGGDALDPAPEAPNPIRGSDAAANIGSIPANAALSKNPALFPLDASWVDMHHDKGQLARSTSAWAQRLFKSRLDDGERPEEILLQCWIMSFSGLMHGLGHCDILIGLRPESARALFDPLIGKPILARLALVFQEASASWIPPAEMALRGWGKLRSDQSIQTASRLKFAWIAHLCRTTAALGLPEMLLRCGKGDMAWLAPPEAHQADSTAQRWTPGPQIPRMALSFMARARRDALAHAPPPFAWAAHRVFDPRMHGFFS